MKVKLDENIPVRLAGVLTNLGHDVDTVASEGLKGKPDGDVWSVAKREGRFLITQDLDFSDVRPFKPGTHPGLLLVRLREPGANALLSRIRAVVQAEGLDSFARCFVVLTDRKLRIRRS
jgi:predicted nuclease of predicted toxin-antitoxin system